MWKYRIGALVLIAVAALIGYFVYTTELGQSDYAFKLGLDLKSGSHLVYKADTSTLASGEVGGAMTTLDDTARSD